jgi:predicted HTH domain antitoxin
MGLISATLWRSILREAYEREIISMSRAGEMLNQSIMEMRALVRTWKEL